MGGARPPAQQAYAEHSDLRANFFTELPATVFDDLTALTKLHLGYNKLTSVAHGTFATLSKLHVLCVIAVGCSAAAHRGLPAGG